MKVRFNRYAELRSFRSTADFARFANKEADKFRELEDTRPDDFKAWASRVADHWAAAANASARDNGEKRAQTALTQNPTFLFASPLVRHLFTMISADRGSAVNELMPFLTGSKDNTNAGQTKLTTVAAFAEFGAVLALESKLSKAYHTAAFEDLQKRQQAELTDLLEADLEHLEQKRTAFDDLHQKISKQAEEYARIEGEAQTARAAEWEETRDQFIRQLGMKTAVTLWNSRARVHRNSYKEARKLAIKFGMFGLVLLLAWIFGGYAVAGWLFDDTAARVASYTAGSIATFTLFVWGLRVVIRSMMSQEHLAMDASARSALAHTYLALEKIGKATENERALILAALFAPVSDGIVKDDAMPALSPTAVAAQMITRPSG